MGTPASLLDLIARGGSMQVGIDQQKEKAQTLAALANAEHQKAAALAVEKENLLTAEKVKAAQQEAADQQVIKDAFAHTNGSRKQVDAYVKANASGKGIMDWSKFSQQSHEQALKISDAERAAAMKVHQDAGALLATVDQVPPEQQQAAYAALLPKLQQMDPTTQWPTPEQFNPTTKQVLYGSLQYADEVLKDADARAKLKETEQRTASAAQKSAMDQRAGFLAALRPDMSAEEFTAARIAFPEAAKQFPSVRGAWIAGAAREAIKPEQRAKVSQEEKILSGMSETGVTAEQQAKLDKDAAQAAETARHNRTSEGLTARGQNMTDARAREMAEITRNASKLEAGAVSKVAEIQDGLAQIGNLRDTISAGKKHMGPIIGGLATAPILGEIIKMSGHTEPAKMQAKIDLIRQTIGKALEGGVLRKEDEEKYRKILPNLADPYDVAVSKIDMLEQKLKTDLKTYIDTQAASGRKVPDVLPKGGSGKADPLGIR